MGRHGHEAGDVEPRRPQVVDQAPGPAPGGSRPSAAPRRGSPRPAPGRPAPAGRSRRRARAGRPTASTRSTARAHAPCCAGAGRGSANARRPAAGRSPRSWRAAPGPGSRPGRRTPASTTSWTRAGVDRLGRGDQGHRAGIAPGAGGGAGDPRRAPRPPGPRRTATVGSRRPHHDQRLATGDAVAPVGEVVGRRGGADVDVVEVVDPGLLERQADRGRDVERGRAVVGRAPRPRDPAGRPAGRGGRRRTRSGRGGRTGRAPPGSGRRDRTRSAATAAPSTPCSRPGQPAWTTATASGRDQGDRRAVGGEHDQREPDAGGDRGVGVGGAAGGASTDDDVAPVHLAQPHPRPAGRRDDPGTARAARVRFSATAAGSSPTWSPRLRVAYGARETPPCRSVKTTRAPGRARSISERRPISAGTRGRRTGRRRRRRRRRAIAKSMPSPRSSHRRRARAT